MWGCTWQPLTIEDWQAGKQAGNYGLAHAFEMSRIAVREHSRSQVWAALLGYSYIPTPEEISVWDTAEAEKRTGKPRGWRPWKQKNADPFHVEPLRDEEQRKRERVELDRFYKIQQ